MRKFAEALTLLISGAGLGANIYFLTRPHRYGDPVLMTLVALVVSFPYAILVGLAHFVRRCALASWIACFGAAAIVTVDIASHYQWMSVRPNALDIIGIAIFALFQGLASAVVAVVALALVRWQGRRSKQG